MSTQRNYDVSVLSYEEWLRFFFDRRVLDASEYLDEHTSRFCSKIGLRA